MKTSLFYCLTFLLLIGSCQLKNEHKSEEEPELITTSQTTDALPCFSSYQIYTETAFLWQASWVSYYEEYLDKDFNDSPRVNFDEQSLNLLYDEVKNEASPGILIWYTLLDQNDTIPSLAIQNTTACKINSRSTILLASSGRSVTTITQNYLETIKNNWTESEILTEGVYTKTDGYNYKWESIKDLMNTNSGQQGIYIRYGLRTLEPDETDYLTTRRTNKTGSIVYCNVLYGNNFEADSSTTLLDFAMPCPEYCGKN